MLVFPNCTLTQGDTLLEVVSCQDGTEVFRGCAHKSNPTRLPGMTGRPRACFLACHFLQVHVRSRVLAMMNAGYILHCPRFGETRRARLVGRLPALTSFTDPSLDQFHASRFGTCSPLHPGLSKSSLLVGVEPALTGRSGTSWKAFLPCTPRVGHELYRQSTHTHTHAPPLSLLA